ncbi:MAG: hypothetical protein CL927_14830 [Deltaproteobacteria bacterium]|nr:hypothetical protein [Deltaproteobacteria bacterium]HCH62565.1 hypothetical protein [Deltaproteobacteria bacterium]
MHCIPPPCGLPIVPPRASASPLLYATVVVIWALPASASEPRAKVLEAIADDNFREAKRHIEDLDCALESATEEVSPEAMGYRYQLEARLQQARGKESDALKALRQACLVHPGGKPDREVLGDGPLIDTYYAVCTEVQQRPEIVLTALELPDAPIRIDGRVPGGDYPVLEGRHLLQIQCADATWSSQWSSLESPSEWAEGCPEGAVAAAEADRSDDPMDMVPFFDDDDDGGDEGSTETTEDAADNEPEAQPDPAPGSATGSAVVPSDAEEETATEDHAGESKDAAGAVATAGAPATTAGAVYTLDLRCAPSPCTVMVDGQDQGLTELKLQVGVDKHKIELKAGDKSIDRTLSLEAQHSMTILKWNHDQNSVEMEHRSEE